MNAQSIAKISEEISLVVDEAALRRRCWSDLCSTFTSAFPGSYAALLNQSFVRPEVSFAVSDGLEESHLSSFLSHYAHVNPWRRFWQHAHNGAILVAERDDPARQFQGSEFYEEWMKAVGDYDAAVGLRLQVEDDQIVYLPVHFSTKLSEVYEPSLEEVMRSARRSLNNALQIACYMRDQGERLAATSALTSLSKVIAFVVDKRLRLKEANQRAVDAFHRGFPVSCRQGTVRFARPSTNTTLAASLAMAPRDHAQKVLMTGDNERWIISVNQLPLPLSYDLIQSHQYFLIQVHALDAAGEPPSSQLLVEAFGLSPSEIRLSQSLASGLMLADAAALNGISYENARQKLKVIFRKTGMASQSELRALLRHLS